jgi:hypothetical protein
VHQLAPEAFRLREVRTRLHSLPKDLVFVRLVDAIARGVAILEKAVGAQAAGKAATDPEVIPLTAWRFMNQAFGEFWKEKNASVKGWRLFQIAFVLSQIPAIASRLECWQSSPALTAKDDREASLLYFSTGGGKSESFFGLLVFCLAFDRLRGKQQGVSALVRYPLRLLTSQQAQRLSQVLAAAYKVKWSWQGQGFDLKGAGFEIGFWVGGGNTPNNRHVRGFSDDWDEASLRRGDYSIYWKKWVRLANCPFCSGTLIALSRRQVPFPAPHGMAGRSSCYWTETGSKGRAKLSSWPSGSIRWKKRSPHSASRGTVAGWYPAPSARS